MKRTASSCRLLLASTLLMGAFSTPSWAAQSPDEPGVYFYPAKGWSVQKDDAQMCSIASQFNNGFTMRFDGDQKWVQGLQINFAQDIFEPGQRYDVSLSVPGVQDTRFSAAAQGRDTLAIGLRRDKDFYKALRQSAVLDMGLEGNDFRFYLTGFSKSAGEFERCMAGADMTAKSEAGYMVNESIAMEENTRAQTESEASAVVEISPENPQIVAQEIPVKETVKLGGQAVASSGMAVNSPSAEQILSTEVQDIVSESESHTGRQRLSEQLAAQIAQDPSLIDTETDGELMPAPRKELSMPPNMGELAPVSAETPEQAEVAVQETFIDETPKAEEMPKMAEVEPESAMTPPSESLLEPVETEAELALEQEIASAEEDMPGAAPEPVVKERTQSSTPPIKVRKERFTGEADFTGIEPAAAPFDTSSTQELRKQVLELEDMVQSLKTENVALTDELETALKESEDERLSIASENWNLESATMKFNEAERQIKRMGQQLQKERAKCSAEKKELEAMLFDPQVTDEAQLARLAQLESQLIAARKEIERYEERIQMLERQSSSQ
ncbi:MAG: hypothetical protein H6861_03915 [Rhodospirillales bacterium]|nr:hypothetical protein [Rhodospirillales bacterium]